MTYTREDLDILAEAAELGPDQGMTRLTEHFTNQFDQARACRDVDALRRGEGIPLGNGEVFARDRATTRTTRTAG